MKAGLRRRIAAGVIGVVSAVVGCRSPEGSNSHRKAAAGLERIVVSRDAKGFVTEETHLPFRPWGMNYGNNAGLMEDFWEKDWWILESDFRKLKGTGANVVRVHLQFGKFMRGPSRPDAAAFKKFAELIRLAEENGLYLDVTGLACYRPSDTPPWYDALEEAGRWAAQANFWAEVARVGSARNAVFCYDLVNEPIVPGEKRKSGEWRSGNLFGGMDFLQFIALDPAGRKREDIAAAWVRRMIAAIRRYDKKTLVTVGLLPWSRAWHHLSGFLPEKVGPQLDFMSVHVYPDTKKPGEAEEALERVAVGKPVVIEETFPLYCSNAELEEFLLTSRTIACGWIGHYEGHTLSELDELRRDGKLTPSQAVYRGWLEMFRRMKDQFASS
jgi:hypothetical protein